MPKKTLFLILTLTLIASGLLYIALSSKTNENSTLPPLINRQVTPIPDSQTTLSINPATLTASQATSSSVMVDINTGSNKVTAVQIELTYDPKALGNVAIAMPPVNQNFFSNSVVLLKEIDTVKGKITYAVGIPPTGSAKSGTGSIAVITFTPLLFAGQTTISFNPSTLVTAENATQSVLKSATNTTILFSGVTN
ncbi:MAG: cohesin domain-containing protein [Patescibacteria group bacterium]